MNQGKEVFDLKSRECSFRMLAVRDTIDILSGRWKITIIVALQFGKRRFRELQREVDGITAKVLSKELRDLEINELVKRTVYDTKPVSVEYELTSYGKSLEKIIDEMRKWGINHRRRIIGKK